MFSLKKAILLNINKLVGTFKNENELIKIIKIKFTKKELKVFIAMQKEIPIKEIANNTNMSEERVKEIYKVSIKKLNQEKIKKELVFFE